MNQARDQAASIFGRWIWHDSNAEFYFEFGKNDAAVNLRDLLVDTDHSRALTVGINKLFPVSDPNANLQFNFEWTQMSQTESRFARNAAAWYHSRFSKRRLYQQWRGFRLWPWPRRQWSVHGIFLGKRLEKNWWGYREACP